MWLCLGWKEFTPSYFGPFRESTAVDESIDLEIPSMLHSVFDHSIDGKWGPKFVQNARVEKGVIEYA
jgi:CRISPR-associated protein Cas5d